MTHLHSQKSKIEKFVTIVFWVIFGTIAMVAFALLFGYVVMLLWNWLMPSLFGLGTLNFWQAVGILILAKILFGGFGSGKSGGRSKKMRSKVKHRMAEKGNSRWKHYDQFWEEEGKQAYEAYLQRKENPENSPED